MSDQPKTTWSDIGTMFKLRVLDLLDALAVASAIAGFGIMLYAFVEGGFLAGQALVLTCIGMAVIPNAIAQAAHRLYRD